MTNVKTLIDLANAKCGTDAELGRRCGLSRSQIADMRSGRLTISPEHVASLCDVLELSGEKAREWVAVSLIENPKNAGRAAMLRRALFACWVLGVGTLATLNDAKATTADTLVSLTLYTSSRIALMRRWVSMLRASRYALWHAACRPC